MTSKAVYELSEAIGFLSVYDDRLEIEPKGFGGFATKGLQGRKAVPFSSITSVQLKEAGFTTGYLQFGVKGGIEGVGGAVEAIYDENTFLFGGLFDGKNGEKNKIANEVANFIREKISTKSEPATPSSPSLADELSKLKNLKDDGVLTESEFESAKARLFRD